MNDIIYRTDVEIEVEDKRVEFVEQLFARCVLTNESRNSLICDMVDSEYLMSEEEFFTHLIEHFDVDVQEGGGAA